MIGDMVGYAHHGCGQPVEIKLGRLRESIDTCAQSINIRHGFIHALYQFADLAIMRLDGLHQKIHALVDGHVVLILPAGERI
jgi:hypothetical protein